METCNNASRCHTSGSRRRRGCGVGEFRLYQRSLAGVSGRSRLSDYVHRPGASNTCAARGTWD